MASGSTVSFNLPTGPGRLWGRTGCNNASPAQCTTGSCGGSGLQCAGTSGVPNTSLFEWNVAAGGLDFYDVSYVDAIDNPIGVTVSNGSCISPNACSASVLSNCPADLRSGSVCLSPCTRYNTDQYCCRGAFGTPATCLVGNWAGSAQTYVNNVHNFCPHSYAYAYDEGSGALQACSTGINYTVTFCPSGSSGGNSSGGSNTSAGGLNGTHQLAPSYALGKRMDDSFNRTTAANPIVVWTANGTGAQNWVFSNAGVSPAGNYNIALAGGPNCVDVSARGTANGTAIILWPCNGGPNQSWSAVPVGNGFYTLHPAHAPDKCLDVPNWTTTDGVQLQIWDCTGGTNQQWQID